MRRWLVRLALALVGLVVLAVGVLWFARIEIVTRIATSVLERQGLGPVRLAVQSVGFDTLELEGLSLRGQAVEAGAIIVHYRPMELLDGYVRQVEIRGIAADVTLGDTGILLDGRPFPPEVTATEEAAGGAPLGGLRIDSFALTDARVTVQRPGEAPVVATLSTTLTLADSIIRGTEFKASLTLATQGEAQTMTIAAGTLDAGFRDDGSIEITLDRGSVAPQGLPWLADGLAGTLIWQAGGAHLQLTSAQLVNLQQPALVVPLTIAGEASLTGALLDFSFRVTSPVEGALKVDLKGQHDQSANSGSATVTLAPIAFKLGGRQVAGLSPAFGPSVPPLAGSVALDGTMRWAGDVLQPNLTLRLKDMAFAAEGVQVSALNGNLRFTKLFPPVTAADQVVTATIASAGETAKLRLGAQLTAKPALNVTQLVVEAAGGKISASRFMVEASRKLNVASTLTVEGVELSEITRIIGIGGLSGEGKLDGQIPLTYAGGKIAISGGRLAARGPGRISYRPADLPPQIAQSGDAVDLTLRVLSGFQYEKLSLDLDKRADGEGTVLLTMHGRNPDVEADQPFNFNIRIESNFDRLVELALVSLTSAQQLLDQAARSAAR